MALVIYPGPGCIVEYMEAGVVHIGLVLEEQGGKTRLLLPNRRETRFGVNRFLPWSGPVVTDMSTRDKMVQALEVHRARRRGKLSEIMASDVLQLWELAQGEVEQATAQWFAELFEAAPTVDDIAAYGQALLQCKSHFKFQPPQFEVLSAETVAARLAEQEAVQRREQMIVGGSQFFRLLWDVYQKKCPLPPQGDSVWPAQDILDYLQSMLLMRIADPEAVEGENQWRALVKALPDMPHMPLHLATAWGLVPPHYNFWLDRADYAPGDAWALEYAEDIERIVREVESADKSSISTLDLPFVSIDNASTKDIDDAFYVETLEDGILRLHVALACPALVWPFDSALNKAVFRRATSVYLPEATYHMMPEVLGVDILSLVAHRRRPSLIVCCDVDSTGAIVRVEPQVAWVTLAANLTYDDCEAILDGQPCEHATNAALPYAEQVRLGARIAEMRQAYRIAQGAIILERPEPEFILVNEDGATLEAGDTIKEDVRVDLKDAAPVPQSRRLVSEMMIMASIAMAEWAQEQQLPLLHRTQDVAVPREYAGVWTEPHDMAKIIRTLVAATLELTPRPHAGLGVSAYVPITSPLRRYSDLINEAQVVHFLLESHARWDAPTLESMLLSLTANLDLSGQIQRFRPRYWRLCYFRQQGDKVWWDAVITDENDHHVMVSLPREQLIVRGKRHLFGERAGPGQKVQVRLGKIRPLYNDITILDVMEV